MRVQFPSLLFASCGGTGRLPWPSCQSLDVSRIRMVYRLEEHVGISPKGLVWISWWILGRFQLGTSPESNNGLRPDPETMKSVPHHRSWILGSLSLLILKTIAFGVLARPVRPTHGAKGNNSRESLEPAICRQGALHNGGWMRTCVLV